MLRKCAEVLSRLRARRASRFTNSENTTYEPATKRRRASSVSSDSEYDEDDDASPDSEYVPDDDTSSLSCRSSSSRPSLISRATSTSTPEKKVARKAAREEKQQKELQEQTQRWREIREASKRDDEWCEGLHGVDVQGTDHHAKPTKGRALPLPTEPRPWHGIPFRRFMHLSASKEEKLTKGQMTNAIKNNEIAHKKRAERCVTYMKTYAVTDRPDLHVETLERRKWAKVGKAKYLQDAHEECLRLVDPDVPVVEDSCMFRDRDGLTLAAFISKHTHEGQTVMDNIWPTEVNGFLANQEAFFSRAHMTLKGYDMRHPTCANSWMEYIDERDLQFWEDGHPRARHVWKQICHHMELWQESKHGEKPLRPARELLGKNKSEFTETIKLMYADDNITSLLNEYVKLLFPDVYDDLAKSAARGRWVEKTFAAGTRMFGGVFLGRVTLYNLQTAIHMDKMDAICVCFCGGQFVGGEAIFPDLHVKFRYRPGDIIIFRSAGLWHMVAPWKPERVPKDAPEGTLPPGRISRVYTTHRVVAKRLLRDDWHQHVVQEATYPSKKRKKPCKKPRVQ
ncbi:hypothetical protein EUX98_g8549 [Antrodiella citrinella]|uniref:Uncharacterized protein n=1 Tax=Antrodiella citrinella TaxID=2447956 RepID=A0A4S4M7S7_9APHY|nr:hypothetical protein EUX98_g8549 [Antrodiella citrinella]